MSNDPWVGTVLAERYRLESSYLRTNAAELYEGVSLSDKAPVLVHLADPELSQNSRFISRFEQEIRQLASLEHPHLISILDYGRERERLYMVMPFLSGGGLSECLRQDWTVEQTNQVVEQIGEVLVYLHEKSIPHLNISPGAIVFDEQSRPHLSLGFGRIHRAIEPASADDVYTLPEQTSLDYIITDPLVDVYAFGVLLWTMLLGQPPRPSIPLDQQLEDQWRRSQLPRAWREVVARATHASPEERFRSIRALLTAWQEAWASSEEQQPGFWERAQQKAQEGRNAAAQFLYNEKPDEPPASKGGLFEQGQEQVQQKREAYFTPEPSRPVFPEIQAAFRLLTPLPDELWPGQPLSFEVGIENSGDQVWGDYNSPFSWQLICVIRDSSFERHSADEHLLKEPLRPQEEQLFPFRMVAPNTPGTYILETFLHLIPRNADSGENFATTTLLEPVVLDLQQALLETLLNPPVPLPVKTERVRLELLGQRLQESTITPSERETIVQDHLLNTWVESGSIREQLTAAKALQQLGPLSVGDSTVDGFVSQFLRQNAAATNSVRRLLTSKETSQAVKSWLQERLTITSSQPPTANRRQPTINDQTPATNSQTPAVNSQTPPAIILPPFLLPPEQIAPSKPLPHKLVLDITPQRSRLTYGSQVYESPTQIDEPTLLALNLRRREYGQKLFAAVLHPIDQQNQRRTATLTGYDDALGQATDGLYLELQLDDSLHSLCWENLCDPDGYPLGISDRRAIYRRVRANVNLPRVDYGQLRVLVMICNPSNLGPTSDNTILKNLAPIDIAGERAVLEGSLLRLKEAGLAEYTIYDGSEGRQATLKNLRDELEKRGDEAVHLLHIVAHGVIIKDQFHLVMEGDGARPHEMVAGKELQEVLARGELRLAILSACLSATAETEAGDGAGIDRDDDAAASPQSVIVLPGLGQQLVRDSHIPAVIAMQGLLKIDTAALFHHHFYDDLARHGRVARALAVTRGAIYDAEKHKPQSGWGVPTLFMGTDDDWLFGMDRRKVKQLDTLPPLPAEAKQLLRQGEWASLQQHMAANPMLGLTGFAAAPKTTPSRPLSPGQNRAYLQETLHPQVNINPVSLGQAVQSATGLLIDPIVYRQVASALNTGKHILLTGPPGTGKTSLAQAICTYAQSQQHTEDPILTTATADWTTFDTIGGYVPDTQGQLHFRSGIFLRAIREASWLVIDEMNRAEIDKAFGELFTVLSGQPIELPYNVEGKPVRVLPSAKGDVWIPPLDDMFYNVVIYPAWRIIGTMNVYDKSFLFNMSFAFMRRFAFIDVDLPSHETYQNLISRWLRPPDGLDENTAASFVALSWLLQQLVNQENPLMRRRALGPAILKDMIAYVRDRHEVEKDAAALSDIFGEALTLYALPQLDGLDHDTILNIYKFLHQLTVPMSAPRQTTLLKRLKNLYPHIPTAEWEQ